VSYQEKLDAMQGKQTTARILAGVGGALIVTGGVMLVVDLGSGKSKGSAAISVSALPGSYALSIGGRL
jgi:hypothetical protein